MGTSLTALGARRVPCLLPSCFSLCGQPRPPPSHRGQTRGCLRFSPLDKPRALCPARPWPKATPPSGAPLSPRSAASDRRGRSVAAPQRLAGSGLGRDPGALAPGPMGCSAGDPRAAPGPAWSTVYPPWLRLPTPRAAWGPARHGGWGGDVTQAHVALDKRHGQPLAGAPTRAGVRSSGGQGNGQQVVVQTRLQEARSLRVPGLRHRPGSAAASGKREPGVEGGGPWAAPDSAQLRALRGASQVPPGTAQSPSEQG